MEATVPLQRLPELQAQIAQINRHYQRAGAPPVELIDTGRREGELAIVRLEGESASVGEWQIVCVLEHEAGRTAVRACVAMGEEQRDYADRHQEAVAMIGSELGALAGRNGHPATWLEHHGRVFAQGLVARAPLERERTHGELAPARAQSAPELELERGRGEEQSLEMEGPR